MIISRLKTIILLTAVIAVTSPFAHAIDYTGTTVGAPTWNRPVAATPPTSLSGSGTATPFSVQPFTVGTSGNYSFLSVANAPLNWDNYTFLYRTGFSSATPLVNAIVGNDDFPNLGRSGFDNISLTAGTQYFLVTTGFGNTDAGTFTNSINGVGAVNLGTGTVVPEAGAGLLTLAGFLPVGALVVLRRKK